MPPGPPPTASLPEKTPPWAAVEGLGELTASAPPPSMGNLNRSRNPFSIAGHHQHLPPCSRAHQIGALALIAATFLLTKAVDRLPCSLHTSSPPVDSAALFDRAGELTWPHRGYGPRLSLKIYVYEEGEIDGLRELMRGRDGKVFPESCVKGQWGTQFSSSNFLGRSGGSSRRAAVSSSRDMMVGSEADPSRTRTTDASPGTFRKLSIAQRSPPVGSAEPKRSSSVRHSSNIKNYESTLKGMESLNFDSDGRIHY